MKKCPNCQKEFPDTMRFCQTDGTPLVEAAAPSDDPLKTTVVRQEDIASAIPAEDPYKTRVAGNIAPPDDDEDDLLQLPEEIDPMKTMVVPPLVGLNKPKETLDAAPPARDERKPEPPAVSPFNDFSSAPPPSAPPPSAPLAEPEPPKFNEPNLIPPSFGELSPPPPAPGDDAPPTVFQHPSGPAGFTPPSETPFASDSPYGRRDDAPIPSPFDRPAPGFEPPPMRDEPVFGGAPSNYGEPASPFGQPASPFDAPKSSFQEPENRFGAGQFNQMNEPSFGQPLQQAEWTPPPAPNAAWQEQGIGPQTPFQPPVAGQGSNQTLPIVSLVFGVISLCCYISPLTGLVALVTGYMGMKNANNDPNQYGGKGLAIAGMVTGGLFFLVGVAYYALIFLGIAGGLLSQP